MEIELAKDAGGYTVAVATDEKRGYGIDSAKLDRSIEAGAMMVIPNFIDTVGICRALGLNM